MSLKRQNGIKGKKGKKKGDDDDDEPEDSDPYFSRSDASADSDGNARLPKIVMFCKHTRYDIVKECGKNWLEYHLTRRKKADWDIAWYDAPIDDIFVRTMLPYQRVNHFPGIYNLARKNMLGRHLMRMARYLPADYNFMPTTYCLPHDYKDFSEAVLAKAKAGGNKRTFIVKPNDDAQGRGIYLTRDVEAVQPEDQCVV